MDMGSTQTNGKLKPEVAAKPTRRTHTAAFKQRVLETADQLEKAGGGIGEFLRKEGLYWSQLSTWRRDRAQDGQAGLKGRKRGRPLTAPAATKLENKKLARRVVSLERKLAQAEAIIDIQKKVAALLAMPDDESES
jgi:transposase-like protein